MSSTRSPDVLVLGLGAMGCAALLHLARQGANVVGIDQFDPPHGMGSSHGETRITRVATGEGAEYVPLAQRSHLLWREYEQASGAALFNACGGLVIASDPLASPLHEQTNFLGSTIENATRFNVPHQLLDASGIERRFPQFVLTGSETAYFEPGAGTLNPEACVTVQLALARAAGATVRSNCRARSIRYEGNQSVVALDDETIRPKVLLVCAGAWLPGLLGANLSTPLIVRRQLLHWFVPDDPAAYDATRFPVFIWNWGGTVQQSFYGFPCSANGVKVATEQTELNTTVEQIDRSVTADESTAMFRTHVDGRLRGVSSCCVVAKSCLYTNAPNAKFRIGWVPGHHSTIAVSACSGHGFKHSAAIGEALATMVTSGETPPLLAPFSW